MGLTLPFGILKAINATLNKIDLRIWIVWLEVNYFGQTILPELFTVLMICGYVFVGIQWKLMLGINQNGNKRDSI
jgi:hypothetical protein